LPLESVFKSVEPSGLGVSLSAIGIVLESVLGSVLESILGAYLEAYSQADWECAFECNWERLRSLLGNVESCRLGVCFQVRLAVT
jgi:hypothetical protein